MLFRLTFCGSVTTHTERRTVFAVWGARAFAVMCLPAVTFERSTASIPQRQTRHLSQRKFRAGCQYHWCFEAVQVYEKLNQPAWHGDAIPAARKRKTETQINRKTRHTQPLKLNMACFFVDQSCPANAHFVLVG